MECLVQLATILSPILAVLLAKWSINSSTKDTDRKIDATVENVKKLMKLQAEITSLQLDIDLWELRFLIERNTTEITNLYKEDANLPGRQDNAALEKNLNRHREKTRKLLDQDFYLKQQDNLKGHINRLEHIKEELKLL